MAEKVEHTLAQTKGTFDLVGRVVNIDRENAYQEKTMDKGKNKGKSYRTLRFGIKTSESNIIQVSMFSFLPDEVYLWDSVNKKGGKVPYETWKKNRKGYEKQKKVPLQTRVGLEKGEDGKNITMHLPSFDVMEYIYDNLNNEDSVMAKGSISRNTYESRSGDVQTSVNYNLESLFKLKNEVDFSDEKFEEKSVFTEQFIFESADLDSRNKTADVYGKVVNYHGKTNDVIYKINFANEEDSGLEQMAKIFAKKIDYGSLLQVHGNLVNRAVTEEVDEEPEDELLALMAGERNRMNTTVTYVNYLEIRGTDALERAKYTEEDVATGEDNFVVKEESAKEEDDDLKAMKGQPKKEVKLEDEDDDFLDFGDDNLEDLPF